MNCGQLGDVKLLPVSSKFAVSKGWGMVIGVFDATRSVVAGIFVEVEAFEVEMVLKEVVTRLAVVELESTSSALTTGERKRRNKRRIDNNRGR
jgi:hypothetical protein